MLKWRLISASVIIAGLLVLLHLDFHYPLGAAGVWLLPLALVVSLMMTRELMDLWSARADLPVRWPVYVAAPLTVLAAGVPLVWPWWGRSYPADCTIGVLGWPLLALFLGIGLSFVGEMMRYSGPSPTGPSRSTGSIALSIFAIAYAGLLLSFLVLLRLWHSAQWGMAALLSLVVIVKLSDTGAFFVGRRWGRHKMAPLVSPGKTWEGAAGGLVAALAGAWMCYAWLVPVLVRGEGQRAVARGPLWGWLLLGGLLAVTGMVGDLAESLLKRDAQRKDSSRWLPGLGGVLDILDSIVFAAPAAYFFFATGLIGPGVR